MNIENVLSLPVLVLNSNWHPIDEKTVRRAFEDMTSGLGDIPPFRGMDIELAYDGELIYANPVDFDDWLKLPVRPGDDFIFTGRAYVRAPRVIISTNYSKTGVKPVSLTKNAIKRRDKQQCQYCHKFFPLDELNIDHVIPQHHGGESSWTNMVCSCIKCNSKKGHKFNHEIGYTLLRQPKELPPQPVVAKYSEAKHPSWAPFIVARKN